MKPELLNEILKFRLYSNYNTKNTLLENSNIIQEQWIAELKDLLTNPSNVRTIKSTVKKLIKQGEKFVDEVVGVKTDADEVLDSVDNLDKASLDKIKVGVINNGGDLAVRQINNMVKDPGFIRKYSNITLDEAKKELLEKGYDEKMVNNILSKFRGNGNKFKQSADDIAKQSLKTLQDEINELKTIVSYFENKSAKEILKNPGLKEYVKSAKQLLNNINDKNLANLPRLTQSDLKSIEAIIKSRDPKLWTRISTMFSKHPKILGSAITLIMIYLYGMENSGYFLSKLTGGAWDMLKSFGGGVIKGIDSRSTTQGAEESKGTTPENKLSDEELSDEELAKKYGF